MTEYELDEIRSAFPELEDEAFISMCMDMGIIPDCTWDCGPPGYSSQAWDPAPDEYQGIPCSIDYRSDQPVSPLTAALGIGMVLLCLILTIGGL